MHSGVVEQPLDRALAGARNAIVDFLCLLGDVDMDGQTGGVGASGQLQQVGRAGGAQRVNRHAAVDARIAGGLALNAFNHAHHAVWRGRKPPLVAPQAGGGKA